MPLLGKIKDAFQGNGRSAVLLKNIVASLGIKGVSMVVSFMLVPLTIGYVSSELYGVWLTLSSVLTWLCFLDIGFSQGLKNKLTEAIANNDWKRGKSLVSTTYFLMILIFVPVCVIIEFLIPVIDWCSLLNVDIQYSNEIQKAMHILIAMACLQMIVNVIISVVAAFQKVALSNTFIPVGNLISLCLIYILTKTCPPSLVALSLTLATMPVLVIIIASIILFRGSFKNVSPNISSFNKSFIKDLFGLGYKFFIINIQVVVLYQSTNILISNIASPYEVTQYNLAHKLLDVAMMFYTIILGPLWPAYTDAYARKDFEWMNRMLKKMRKLMFVSMAFCFIVAIFSPFIFKIWIGDQVSIPYILTFMVALYTCVCCWRSLNGTLVIGIGKAKVQTINAIFGMILHIPLSFFLGKYFGFYGVVISMITINTLYAIILYIQVNKIQQGKASGIWNE